MASKWVSIIFAVAVVFVSQGCAPPPTDLTKLPPTEQSLLDYLTWCKSISPTRVSNPQGNLRDRMESHCNPGTDTYYRAYAEVVRYDIRETNSTLHPYQAVALVRTDFYSRDSFHDWVCQFSDGSGATFGFRPAPKEKCYQKEGDDYYNGDWELLEEEGVGAPGP